MLVWKIYCLCPGRPSGSDCDEQYRKLPNQISSLAGMKSVSPNPRAESELRVSLVDNGLVGPYSATVLVTLPSAPDHRPQRLASAR
ncbi:hypothetical protein TNCV_3200261 [Trichonephila clavipes]|nr:hypothetical protein TNCV_3200261 [Trichonephila clavipes]